MNIGIIGGNPTKPFVDVIQNNFKDFPEVDHNANIVVSPKSMISEAGLCNFIIDNQINVLLMSDKLFIPELQEGIPASKHAEEVLQSIIVYFW